MGFEEAQSMCIYIDVQNAEVGLQFFFFVIRVESYHFMLVNWIYCGETENKIPPFLFVTEKSICSQAFGPNAAFGAQDDGPPSTLLHLNTELRSLGAECKLVA